MNRLKYIMLEDSSCFYPVIFPDHVSHNEMLDTLRHTSKRLHDAELVSAGFYSGQSGNCYGKSITLKVKAREEDTNIIKTWNEHEGYKSRYEEL